jgi:diguanylate cyclase (GGDEF)-like protein
LRQGLRPTDIVARYGGEEFCAFLAETEIADAIGAAERLREAVAALSINHRGKALNITVSVGVSALRNGDLVASVSDADDALYRAKGLGRNQVAVSQGDVLRTASASRSKLRIVR